MLFPIGLEQRKSDRRVAHSGLSGSLSSVPIAVIAIAPQGLLGPPPSTGRLPIHRRCAWSRRVAAVNLSTGAGQERASSLVTLNLRNRIAWTRVSPTSQHPIATRARKGVVLGPLTSGAKGDQLELSGHSERSGIPKPTASSHRGPPGAASRAPACQDQFYHVVLGAFYHADRCLRNHRRSPSLSPPAKGR